MSGVKFNISVLDSKVQTTLEEMRKRAIRLGPAMKSVGEYMLREIEEHFRTETDPLGLPWVPLSERRLKEKKHPKILTETTRLRGSMTYQANDEMVRIGTNVEYGAIHQFGGEITHPAHTQVIAFKKNGKFMSRKAASKIKTSVSVRIANIPARTVRIPKRSFLGVTGENRRKILKILERHLEKGNG